MEEALQLTVSEKSEKPKLVVKQGTGDTKSLSSSERRKTGLSAESIVAQNPEDKHASNPVPKVKMEDQGPITSSFDSFIKQLMFDLGIHPREALLQSPLPAYHKTTTKRKYESDDDDRQGREELEVGCHPSPTATKKPIVTLQQLLEKANIDENRAQLAEERAKLYRETYKSLRRGLRSLRRRRS